MNEDPKILVYSCSSFLVQISSLQIEKIKLIINNTICCRKTKGIEQIDRKFDHASLIINQYNVLQIPTDRLIVHVQSYQGNDLQGISYVVLGARSVVPCIWDGLMDGINRHAFYLFVGQQIVGIVKEDYESLKFSKENLFYSKEW